MARVTIEDCLDKIDNHFKLVLIASHRARQLKSGVTPSIETADKKPTTIALREISEGLVDESILDEPLVKDANADAELADLIAHGLMGQAMENEIDDLAEDSGEEENADTLEIIPETLNEMEKMADLNLDHLKTGDGEPNEEDKALAEELTESEIAMGDKLLIEAGETPIEPTAEGTAENPDEPAEGLPSAAGDTNRDAEEKPD